MNDIQILSSEMEIDEHSSNSEDLEEQKQKQSNSSSGEGAYSGGHWSKHSKESNHSIIHRSSSDEHEDEKVNQADNSQVHPQNFFLNEDNTVKKRSSFVDTKKTKIQLTWKNVIIKAKPKKRLCCNKNQEESFTILDEVSGTVCPGQFLAIIGSSGSGKTTLLNFLSGKDPSRNLEKHGEVLVNGVDRHKIDFGKYVGYVQQEDILFQTLTVRECLEFAAKMKLPPKSNYNEIVDRLIVSLGLEKAADTRIGGPLVKGVSGGERKRTSIGVELITDPSLIFLDEPTTGLDSYTAQHVVEVLEDLALSGRTVICTIHQPSSEVFHQFDQLMLLMQGNVIYMNSANKSIDYFSKIGYSCPENTNPAEFFMEIMSIEKYYFDAYHPEELNKKRSAVEDDYSQQLEFFCDQYQNSELKCDCEIVWPEVKEIDKDDKSIFKISKLTQFFLLLKRELKNISRIPLTSYVKMIAILFVCIIVILVYGRLGNDSQSIQTRNGILFFCAVMFVFNATNSILLVFPDERLVFLREQHNELYSPTIYFFSKIISELPSILYISSIPSLLIYFCVGLNTNDASHFFIFYSYSIILVMTGSGLGMIGGTLFPTREVAITLNPLLMIPMMLLSGFFVSQDNPIPILKPIQYLSPFKYAYQAYVLNEYDGLYLTCSPKCDPVSSLGFTEDMKTSICATIAIGFGFYLISYISLILLARRAK